MRDIKLVCNVVAPDGMSKCGELQCNCWTFAAFVATGVASKLTDGVTVVNVRYADTKLTVNVVEPSVLPENVTHEVYCDVVTMAFNEVVLDFIDDYGAKSTIIELD